MTKLDGFTYAEINLGNISHNIDELKRLLKPGVMFMAVVKADAYGHGAKQVAKHIEKKVDYLSVANIAEALELKSAGIKKPVLLLSETSASNAPAVVRNGFIQTVYTMELAKALSREAVKQKRTAVVHMKVDTGMGRIGARIEDAYDLYSALSRLPGIKVEGVFTHLARADERSSFTARQLDAFRSFISRIDGRGLIFHAANSAGTIYHQRTSHMDMVRVGLSMYGIFPPGGGKSHLDLRPALEFRTKVVYFKRVAAGTPLSYGSTYVTDKGTGIATIPVGYADGLPRALSNKGHVLINGRRFPIAGRVCMDLTLVNVGNADVSAGDEVTLIGAQGREMISVDEVARLADTISYEIICGIGKRVPRIYVK